MHLFNLFKVIIFYLRDDRYQKIWFTTHKKQINPYDVTLVLFLKPTLPKHMSL